jgi:molybdopterin-containing oxidoreductase family membrane subunit
MEALRYLFFGAHGHTTYAALMWLFVILSVVSLCLLLNRQTRESASTLCIACAATFCAMFIEKGVSFVIGGFVNNPFHRITEYVPTLNEFCIVIGIWAIGAFIISLFYKVAVFVKSEDRYGHGTNLKHQHEMRG